MGSSRCARLAEADLAALRHGELTTALGARDTAHVALNATVEAERELTASLEAAAAEHAAALSVHVASAEEARAAAVRAQRHCRRSALRPPRSVCASRTPTMASQLPLRRRS